MAERSSVEVVYAETFQQAILAAYSARPAAALVVTPGIRLIGAAGINLQPATTRVELAAAEAAYSGYAELTPTVSAPVRVTAADWGLLLTAVFVAGAASPFVSDTVKGWWLDDGTAWLVGEAWAEDLWCPLSAAGDFIELAVTLPEPGYREAAI